MPSRLMPNHSKWSNDRARMDSSWIAEAGCTPKMVPTTSRGVHPKWCTPWGVAEPPRSVTHEGRRFGSCTPPRVLLPDSGNAVCCGRRHVNRISPWNHMRAELDQRGPIRSHCIWCRDGQQTVWQLSAKLCIGGAAETCSRAWGILSIGRRRGKGSTNPSSPRRSLSRPPGVRQSRGSKDASEDGHWSVAQGKGETGKDQGRGHGKVELEAASRVQSVCVKVHRSKTVSWRLRGESFSIVRPRQSGVRAEGLVAAVSIGKVGKLWVEDRANRHGTETRGRAAARWVGRRDGGGLREDGRSARGRRYLCSRAKRQGAMRARFPRSGGTPNPAGQTPTRYNK